MQPHNEVFFTIICICVWKSNQINQIRSSFCKNALRKFAKIYFQNTRRPATICKLNICYGDTLHSWLSVKQQIKFWENQKLFEYWNICSGLVHVKHSTSPNRFQIKNRFLWLVKIFLFYFLFQITYYISCLL